MFFSGKRHQLNPAQITFVDKITTLLMLRISCSPKQIKRLPWYFSRTQQAANCKKCVKFCGLHHSEMQPTFIRCVLLCEIKLKFELKFKAEFLDACSPLHCRIAVYTRALAVRKHKQRAPAFPWNFH